MFISLPAYRLTIIIWIAIAILIFFLLRRITAPYGRHTSQNWGPLIDNHIGWILMELPALLVMGYYLLNSLPGNFKISSVMISLFCLHYFNRTIIFPLRLHTKGKKIPLLIVVSGIFFNLVNTILLGYYFKHFGAYENRWFLDPRFIAGLLLFFIGLYINWKSDDILIHLRMPNETHYVIPIGWLFNWVSCPNMFGELIEWLGFAILCWNLPALSFFIWSAANLIPRALSHHRWYQNKFPEYPEKRKAVIPYLI